MQRGCFNYQYEGGLRGSYWLRLDSSTKWGVYVGAKGGINKKKNQVTMTDNGVRPVLNLSLAFNEDTPGATTEDLKTGERITIDGFAILQRTDSVILDRLGYYPEGNPNDFSKCYESGTEAEYLLVKMDLTNLTEQPVDFLNDVYVEVVFNEDFRYRGWAYQYNYQNPTSTRTYVNEEDNGRQNANYVIGNADQFSIEPGETGHYCFGCTVPNAVITSDAPLQMMIRLDGNEVFLHLR